MFSKQNCPVRLLQGHCGESIARRGLFVMSTKVKNPSQFFSFVFSCRDKGGESRLGSPRHVITVVEDAGAVVRINAEAASGPCRYLVQVIMQKGENLANKSTPQENGYSRIGQQKHNLIARERHIQDLPTNSLGVGKAILVGVVWER